MNMKSLFFALAACATLAFVSCGKASKQVAETNPILTIEGGQVQGVLNDSTDIIVYKGIPYAAAPVGENRWRKPQPVKPWEGVLIADKFGAAAVQHEQSDTTNLYFKEFYWQGDPERSEDCLYLNIWTPSNSPSHPEQKLPVALWIHGGGYVQGYGHEVTMDGDAWAKRGVILVTFNYRLGLLGFFSHPLLNEEDPDGTSGNYGTYDQIAALKWVKNNIAQFGGDPENITIFGQSAGGGSVRNLSISEPSKGLINRAIIQSCGGIDDIVFPNAPTTNEEVAAQGKEIMDKAGLTTLEQMRAASVDELNAALANYGGFPSGVLGPHSDGKVSVLGFKDAVMNNTIADVPFMIGCTTGDGRGPGAAESISRFCEVRDSLGSYPVYRYLFARGLPGPGNVGAYHSSELWYTFQTLGRSWRPFTEADYQLSDEMVDAWTNFCKFGNPNGAEGEAWAPYKKDAPFIKEFDVKK
jgi:para-nitrobenzyl esterase